MPTSFGRRAGSSPPRFARGSTMVEYVVATGILLGALLVPFGDDDRSAVERVLFALRAEHSSYMYMAGLPSLPRDDGTGGPIPPGAIGSGGSGSGNPSTPGDGGTGGPFDPGSGNNGPGGSGPGSGGIGGPGGSGGNGGGSNPGGGGLPPSGDPGGSNPDDPVGNTTPEAELPPFGETDGGIPRIGTSQIEWEAALALGTATAIALCEITPEQTPEWTDDDLSALHASKRAYGGDTPQTFANLGIRYAPEEGFSASLTQTPEGLWVLAFRGTDELLPTSDDWENNAQQAVLGKASQYEQARDLAEAVSRATGGNVLFTGHSLGGGLASAAAHATNGRAITFNAAGLHTAYRTGSPSDIRAHYVVGEILRAAQTAPFLPQAIGTPIAHSASCLTDPFRRHLINAFDESVERWQEANHAPEESATAGASPARGP